MGLERALNLPTVWLYPLRVAAATAALLLYSRAPLAVRPSSPLLSIGLGVAVFALWVGPDVVFGPAYRHFWLFENSLTGKALSSIPAGLQGNFWFLTVR